MPKAALPASLKKQCLPTKSSFQESKPWKQTRLAGRSVHKIHSPKHISKTNMYTVKIWGIEKENDLVNFLIYSHFFLLPQLWTSQKKQTEKLQKTWRIALYTGKIKNGSQNEVEVKRDRDSEIQLLSFWISFVLFFLLPVPAKRSQDRVADRFVCMDRQEHTYPESFLLPFKQKKIIQTTCLLISFTAMK